ncbi:MAG TPA: cytochrome c oxidase assembly protein [Acidimicrobiales bacterium]|nr:cytochrome c oxidase assembly protein [Acidimicrobiales bacterium]
MNVGAASADPLAFALHPAAWVGVVACCTLFVWWLRRPERTVTPAEARAFVGAMVVLLAATTWPLAGLAAHHLLVALVVQRLLLLLAVPPLLLRGLPRPLVSALTRPAPLDALARVCSRPVAAVAVVTVIAAGTLNVPAVVLQAHSAVARGAFDLLVLGAGLVLWMPVLRPVPATGTASHLARAGYLVIQSIVPSFLSVVWIFARHPLYPPYARGRTFRLGPLADQELSGFVAKLGTIFVLWAVAFAIVLRAERVAERGEDPEPLMWSDVERELERVARRERQAATRPPGDRQGGLRSGGPRRHGGRRPSGGSRPSGG